MGSEVVRRKRCSMKDVSTEFEDQVIFVDDTQVNCYWNRLDGRRSSVDKAAIGEEKAAA